MLGQAIRGTHNIETLVDRAELVHVRVEFLGDRIVRLLWMKWIGDRTFDRLVMFGKWSIGKGGEWPKDTPDSFGIHDERTHVIRGLGIDFEVWHIVPHPFLLRLVPP